MNNEVLAEITLGDLVYLGSTLAGALVVALIIRFVTSRLKRRLRDGNETSLLAQMLDELDGPLVLWTALLGLYLGLLGMPPLGDHLSAVRQGFTIFSICIVVYAGLRVQGDAVTWSMSRIGSGTGQTKVLNSLEPMVTRVLAIALLVMGILIILEQLGISIAPLVAGLGIGGLAVALALQGTLTNFFAGLNVLTDGSLRVGDFVEMDSGMRGYVDQIGWRTTRILMPINNMVIIPNSRLAESVATNYSFPADEISVYIEVGVSYSSDLDHVERVTVEVAKKVMQETPGSKEGYEPSIWYNAFADSNINFWVILRADGYMESWLLKHNFIKALFRRYLEEGIEISFPARNVFMRNGTAETSVSKPPAERDT